MKLFYKSVFFIALLFIFFGSCAKRGKPTGGPKDSIPPLMVKAIPDYKTLHFNEKKIKLLFDEYIKITNIGALVISPPLKYNPIISPTGYPSKQITIKILDTLLENTTYTFNFGNSIADNNENNELGTFKYIFSTGDYIDSLKVRGEISDALHKEPDENVTIQLYEFNEEYTDSIIFKEKPMYLSSTLDTTLFEITNIKEGKYYVIALKQSGNSYIYNPKQDKIGFLKDPITLPQDSIFNITLFKEILDFKVNRPKEITKGHLIFGYEGKADSLTISFLDTIYKEKDYLQLFDSKTDTIHFWYKDIEADSINFKIRSKHYIDTLTFKPRSKEIDTVVIKSSTSSALEMRDTFALESTIPLVRIDTSKFSIIDVDSLNVPFKAFINKYQNKIVVDFPKKYEQEYNVSILPNAIETFYETYSDTLSYTLKTKKIDSYGIINITVSNVSSNVIIELLSSNLSVVDRVKINENTSLSFKDLKPGNYSIRAIFDDNNNGRWDTGNYFQKMQPEKVQYLDILLELSANWELNENFTLTPK